MGKAQSKPVPLARNQQTFINMRLEDLTPETAIALFDDLMAQDSATVKEYLKQLSDKWHTIPLKIAVVGRSGTGKSSFINAFRNLNKDNEEDKKDWAETGTCFETTWKVQEYKHPKHPNVKICDVPGLNGRHQKTEKARYLKTIGISNFDFFIFITNGHFSEPDVWLAKQILELRKNFVFVRTCFDKDLLSMPYDMPEKWTVESATTRKGQKQMATWLRDKLEEDLQRESENINVNFRAKIFLINNHKRNAFDFHKLEKEIIKRVPSEKTEALLAMLPTLSTEVIRAKLETLKHYIWKAAALSGVAGAIPVPIAGSIVDLGLLVDLYYDVQKELGLDSESLARTAKLYGVPEDDLEKWVNNYIPVRGATEIAAFVARIVASVVVWQTVEEGLKFVPVVNVIVSAVSVPVSFGMTFWTATEMSKVMGEVAANMLTKCMTSTYKSWDQDIKAPFNIAVFGELGSGKASLINSLRHLDPQNENHKTLRAAVDMISQTERFAYPYPDRQHIKIWKLPSVGWGTLSRENYGTSQDVQLDAYDFYMIVGKSDFSEEDLWMASEIEKLGETPVFVRTHLDITLHRMRMDDPHTWPADRPEAEMVKHVREATEKPLQKFDAEVFLIDANDRTKFDFSSLEQKLALECPMQNLRENGMVPAADTRNVNGQ